MRGINKLTLVGCLGQDPEVKITNNNLAITIINVATTEKFGEKVHTEWHKVTFFGKLAEICNSYLKKGSKVYIEGSVRSSKYKDKEGNDRISYGVIGGNLLMLDSKGSDRPVEQVRPSVSTELFDDCIPF